MKTYKYNEKTYEVMKDYKNGFEDEQVKEKLTDYFDDYDYVLGDWSYGKLRLKGFNDKENKNCKPLNDIKNVDEYIKKHCSYECRYFILKKVK